MNPGDSLPSDLVCSNCGGDRVSLVQRGIDNFPIGKCWDCSAKEPNMPSDSDHSAKAEASRRRIAQSQTTRYQASLVPLVERTAYRPRAKRATAETASLWDDA